MSLREDAVDHIEHLIWFLRQNVTAHQFWTQ